MGLEVKKRRVPLKRRSVGHRHYANEQRFRSLRAAVISTLVLTVLAVGAGFAYAWYSGQQPNDIPDQPAIVTETEEAVEPPKPKKDQPVGVAVQLINSPVAPGENTSISIHTNAFASCKIEVAYDEIPSTDESLVRKKADEFGIVTWSWKVEESAALGEWPVTVTCKNSKYWGVAKGDLKIAYPKES